jgi:hypothetical protein
MAVHTVIATPKTKSIIETITARSRNHASKLLKSNELILQIICGRHILKIVAERNYF